VRLGTCIALELAIAAGAVGGVWFGVGQASKVAGTYLEGQEAAAATPFAPAVPSRLPRSHLEVAPLAVGNVFGVVDDELLSPLGASKVTRLKLNHGGTSLSLRLDFASGARAAFKPEQIHPQSDPRREIAAYRIDRLLGIGHVPPAKAIAIPVAELLAATEPSYQTYTAGRLAEEAITHGGVLRGELSWWIPEIRLAKIGPYRIDEKDGRALWRAYLQVGARVPEELRPMVEQLSAVVLFDVLIDNPDRWSGSNTMASPDQRILYFMDNSLSFSIFGLGHEANLNALRDIQVFPRGLVRRMRALTAEMVTGALAIRDDHGLAPLLNRTEIRAMLTRRDHLIEYIDGLIAELGEEAVLALP
jgi:hypothetical protein